MSPSQLRWLKPSDPPAAFPPLEQALTEPDGLLAAGGDLSPQRLLYAYRHGIFPWYNAGDPILWWSPDPRLVLFPDEIHISRSLRRTLRRGAFQISRDTAFTEVIRACAAPRHGVPGTWITPTMAAAYTRLHEQGVAHSIEVWMDGELAGGLYGLGIGAAFFGESMFTRRTDASKIALAHLAAVFGHHPAALIDCQLYSTHLAALGARELPRYDFTARLERACAAPAPLTDNWRLERTAGLVIGHALPGAQR